MKTKHYLVISALAGLGTLLLATGCATFEHRSRRHASSVVQFLYPNKSDPVEQPAIPVLSLPLRVGVAFVPDGQSHGNGYMESGHLSEAQKMALMDEAGKHFRKYPFVKSIELIPSAYLQPKGSFANLDQIRTMLGVDVIALLSYDQVQFTDEGLLSFTYWTLVGAYIVNGEKNETRTMMDAAVYDIASRKMLFRAPGISTIKGRATLINLDEQLRKDVQQGFQAASTNMVASLQSQLELFQERVKQSPDEYKIVHKPGYISGGATGWMETAMAAGLLLLFLCFRTKATTA